MRVVEVSDIRLELPSNQPVLMLQDVESRRYLPLWIGAAEANAISLAMDGITTARPLTHDLLADVIDELGSELISVTISELRDGTFYAELNLAGDHAVSARPSDAVALALKEGVTIYVADAVMEEAALDIDDEDFSDDAFDGEAPEDEVERFRAFLEEINPEDFSS